MKNSFLTVGLSSSMSFMIGFIFKVMHWPGANAMMYSGLMVFCCLYAPVWLIQRRAKVAMTAADQARWGVAVTAGIVFAVGSLFKALHYPGAGMMIVFGGIAFATLFLPMTFYKLWKTSES